MGGAFSFLGNKRTRFSFADSDWPENFQLYVMQEIIINIMEIVSGNNIRNRNKELPSSNQLEYLIDEWGRRKRRRIGDGVLRSNRRALFSKEWKEEKREMDKPELEINAKDVGEYAGDCHHLVFCISFMVFFGHFSLELIAGENHDGVPIFENSSHFNLHALNQK
ncbi:hypothetical protein Bca52824_089867 [Brassica carinata]|uniref:Uncharacterized protein n=1 Tax=Brassica carinata TaxID=52824 RepID=A0A8X7NUS4_BRACI|nr:hypothetical protein Bca52824_089867 [Brassica carinata]